eukprot:209233_1
MNPESICIHKVYNQKNYILYDPHPRIEKEFFGAHFLIFADANSLKTYLKMIFSVIDLTKNRDMINQCEVNYIQKTGDILDWNMGKLSQALSTEELDLLLFNLRSTSEYVTKHNNIQNKENQKIDDLNKDSTEG